MRVIWQRLLQPTGRFRRRSLSLVVSLQAMHLYFAIVCAVLLIGCQSPSGSHSEAVRIADALKQRLTPEEARHILLDDIDRAIQAAQKRSATHEADTEAAVLSRQRQRLSARFDSFLSRSRTGDEVWDYRTYVTADQRGGESGFALVRAGRVVEHMGVMIYD